MTTITLRYERLFGFCKVCFSLCYDDARCPPRSTLNGGHRGLFEEEGEDRE